MGRNLKRKKIIVTGASSGIGERMVWHIAKNGGIPIMLARSSDKLQAQCQLIRDTFPIECFMYRVDLYNKAEFHMVLTRILDEHEQIHGLINNAGFGVFDYVESMKTQDMERMFQLNVFALIQGTKRMLPHFSENNEGHIINIASQAAKIATPKSAVYTSTKHAVLGFTNVLRLEVKERGIDVTAVNLGPVRTNFFATADPDGTYQKNIELYMLDPDKVARKIVQHLFTAKREMNLPWWMEMGSKIYQLFPRVLEFLLKRQFDKK